MSSSGASSGGSSGTPGLMRPSVFGLLGYNVAPELCTTQLNLGAGNLLLNKFTLPAGLTVSKLRTVIHNNGAGLTGVQGAALYSSAGVLLGQTVDATAAWTAGGSNDLALSGGALALAAGDYYVGLLSAASTTMPQTTGSLALDNVTLSQGGAHASILFGGSANFPANFNPAAGTLNNGLYFVGLL